MNSILVMMSAIFGGATTAVVAALAAHRRTSSEADHIEAQAVDVISRAAADFVERSTAMASKNEAKLERQIADATTAANGGAPGSALPSVRGSTRAGDPALNPTAVGAVQGSNNVSGAGEAPAAPRGKPKKRP